MTDKELKAINEYMTRARLSFCCNGIGDNFNPDSNSAWEVVQEMERKGDWKLFYLVNAVGFLQTLDEDTLGNGDLDKNSDYCLWLFNPVNFFNCFAKWLLEKEVSGTPKAPENSHFKGTKNDLNT